MSPEQISLPALAVAAMLVLAGCSTTSGPLNEQEQTRVADKLADRLQNIDRVEATVAVDSTLGERSFNSTTHIRANLETGEYRSRVIAPEERAGDVSVFNGSTMVVYDASENTVRKTHLESSSAGMRASLDQAFDRVVEETDIIVNGTERVNGRETHKVTLVPVSNASAAAESLTLWVDADRLLPVKMQTTMSTSKETTMTVTFSDVTINPEFAAGTFEFDAPSDATVETPSESAVDVERYTTHSGLTAGTEVRVPPAELGAFSFESGHVVSNGETPASTTVGLTYANERDSVSVRVTPLGNISGVAYEDAAEVTIAGHTGQYREIGSTGNLMWTCDGTQYLVHGQVEKATLVSVARSIGC